MNISICVKNKKKNACQKLSHEEKKHREVKIKSRREKKRIKKATKAQKLKLLKANAVQRREIKRDLKRRQRLEREKRSIHSYSAKITAWMSKSKIHEIAVFSGYIKRIDLKILPLPFLLTLAYSTFSDGASVLSSLASNLSEWFGISVTAQAVSYRMSNKNTVRFLKNMFCEAMAHHLANGLKNCYAVIFSQFTSVKLEDSSQIKLHEKVSKAFKGCGGSASAAAMKLNTVYCITEHTISHFDIASGATPDQALSKGVRKLIKKGELWIRDLGYFNILDMQAIHHLLAYFLSRLKKDVKIFEKSDDIKPIDIYKLLEENTKDGASLDKEVYIGEFKSRLKVRIIAEKVPGYVQQKRIANYKANKIKRDKRKEMKKDYFEWFGYSIFITNITRQMAASTAMIMAIYKIRWQIELFFKRIKSVLQFHIIHGKSKNSVLCAVYAKLISLLMCQSVLSYIASICDEEELSEYKVVRWLKGHNRLEYAIIYNDMEGLLEKLIKVLHLLCKDKRKSRKSTFKCLEEAFRNDVNERDNFDLIAV
jgi:Transposase DDE domain